MGTECSLANRQNKEIKKPVDGSNHIKLFKRGHRQNKGRFGCTEEEESERDHRDL